MLILPVPTRKCNEEDVSLVFNYGSTCAPEGHWKGNAKRCPSPIKSEDQP